jgi:hypothetical protein
MSETILFSIKFESRKSETSEKNPNLSIICNVDKAETVQNIKLILQSNSYELITETPLSYSIKGEALSVGGECRRSDPNDVGFRFL